MRTFAIPIFGSRVFFTRKREEAQAWLDKRGFEEAMGACDGFSQHLDGHILVYVKDDNPALLAHECFHAAGRALEYSGIESRDEELLAYLLQWIMAECQKR